MNGWWRVPVVAGFVCGTARSPGAHFEFSHFSLKIAAKLTWRAFYWRQNLCFFGGRGGGGGGDFFFFFWRWGGAAGGRRMRLFIYLLTAYSPPRQPHSVTQSRAVHYFGNEIQLKQSVIMPWKTSLNGLFPFFFFCSGCFIFCSDRTVTDNVVAAIAIVCSYAIFLVCFLFPILFYTGICIKSKHTRG